MARLLPVLSVLLWDIQQRKLRLSPFEQHGVASGWLSLKCAPEYALELREHHSGIEGAYHFNKKYWNQVSLQGNIDDKLILSLIDHSYEEVIKKFTRKLKKEYDEIP